MTNEKLLEAPTAQATILEQSVAFPTAAVAATAAVGLLCGETVTGT